MTTNYWGNAGAGILFFCENEILLVLRSENVDEPETWGIPGGSILGDLWVPSEEHSLPLDLHAFWTGALRETEEEMGTLPEPIHFFDIVEYRDNNFIYTTFLVEITSVQKSEWAITLNWENDDVEWFDTDELPAPLHFGMEYIRDQRALLF